MLGKKYKLSESPISFPVVCEGGAVLTFWFTTEVRKRSFIRRYGAYGEQVSGVIKSRYRGIYLESDELALIDLYTRIETGERRIEILDVFGVNRELSIGDRLTISARIK